MGTCLRQVESGCLPAEPEVTDEALGAFGQLLVIIGRRLRTHATRDGGLICEDSSSRTRPAMWRISPDGVVLPDSRYSFRLGGFTPVALPQGT